MTEPDKNYQDTILDLVSYANQEDIPYQYWLADSWWYFKGSTGGVTNWTARPDVFPQGMEGIYNITGLQIQGHNRYWDAENVYAKQNGGEYEFLIDLDQGYSIPTEQRFWDDLLRDAKQWGLTVYEQDWLDAETSKLGFLTSSATLGRQWLTQMANAAAKNDVTIQYCMSMARHILTSAELPAVTQARASEDYHPGEDQWSPLGTTAMFAYALGKSTENFLKEAHIYNFNPFLSSIFTSRARVTMCVRSGPVQG